MKTRGIKIFVLAFMAMCGSVLFSAGAEAGSSTKTIYVPENGIYTVHGTYTKSSTSSKVYATNYSGYGEMGYCYGHVRAKILNQWTNYSTDTQIWKNDTQKTLFLSNTVNQGISISLRLTGPASQSGYDTNRIKFSY